MSTFLGSFTSVTQCIIELLFYHRVSLCIVQPCYSTRIRHGGRKIARIPSSNINTIFIMYVKSTIHKNEYCNSIIKYNKCRKERQ